MEVDSVDSDTVIKIWRRLDSDELIYGPDFPSNVKSSTELSQNGPSPKDKNPSSSTTTEKGFSPLDYTLGYDLVPEFGPKKFTFKSPFLTEVNEPPDRDLNLTVDNGYLLGKGVKECDFSEMMEIDSAELEGERNVPAEQPEDVVDDVVMIPAEISGKDVRAGKSERSRKRGAKRKPKRKVRRTPGSKQKRESKSLKQRNRKPEIIPQGTPPLILSRPVRDTRARFSSIKAESR